MSERSRAPDEGQDDEDEEEEQEEMACLTDFMAVIVDVACVVVILIRGVRHRSISPTI